MGERFDRRSDARVFPGRGRGIDSQVAATLTPRRRHGDRLYRTELRFEKRLESRLGGPATTRLGERRGHDRSRLESQGEGICSLVVGNRKEGDAGRAVRRRGEPEVALPARRRPRDGHHGRGGRARRPVVDPVTRGRHGDAATDIAGRGDETRHPIRETGIGTIVADQRADAHQDAVLARRTVERLNVREKPVSGDPPSGAGERLGRDADRLNLVASVRVSLPGPVEE